MPSLRLEFFHVTDFIIDFGFYKFTHTSTRRRQQSYRVVIFRYYTLHNMHSRES